MLGFDRLRVAGKNSEENKNSFHRAACLKPERVVRYSPRPKTTERYRGSFKNWPLMRLLGEQDHVMSRIRCPVRIRLGGRYGRSALHRPSLFRPG